MNVGPVLSSLLANDGAKLVAALKAGQAIDWRGMLAAFKAGDTADGAVQLVEGGLKIGGVFFPPLAIAASDLEAMVAFAKVLQALGAKPADPNDPAMRHAAGVGGGEPTTSGVSG